MKMKYLLTIFIAILLIATAVFITIQNNLNIEITKDKIKDDKNQTSVGNLTFNDAVNTFAFDIFNKINEGKNIFISPYSIFTALAMTYEGARGETAEEMANVLNIKQDNESFHQYMKNLYLVLNSKNNFYNISTANALWVQKNYKLLESYLKIIQDYYNGNATELDFNFPEQASDIINQWVEENTNGLIKNLILPEYISPLTALILTNAIYFKGLWKVQFEQINTTDRDFKISSEKIVQVPTMTLKDTKDYFNYTETNDLQILELCYTGDDISMMILLPKEKDLTSVINEIDNNDFLEWKEEMVETNVDIYLPKFGIETMYSLNDYLEQLGMIIPFSSLADFSGMTGFKELYISKVIHKAYINVSEEGTEAAAATAVIMFKSVNGEQSRIVFNCDHPFMYLILHRPTNTILFMGSVTDPTN
jgi:serpin B